MYQDTICGFASHPQICACVKAHILAQKKMILYFSAFDKQCAIFNTFLQQNTYMTTNKYAQVIFQICH